MNTPSYGICHLNMIPVRVKPADTSEMVTQLLFGETFVILEELYNWLHIEITYDGYKGWIDRKQVRPISATHYQRFNNGSAVFANELVHLSLSQSDYFPIVLGSTLHDFDGVYCKIGTKKYTYQGDTIRPDPVFATSGNIVRLAKKYIGAPYLWGGRTPFGIDCSGFTQMVLRLAGLSLPRDAYQQAEKGRLVNNLESSQPGDLAFCTKEDSEKITHVGIIIANQEIIHASGQVRIDKLHNSGIFNVATKKYSHRLKLIKRMTA